MFNHVNLTRIRYTVAVDNLCICAPNHPVMSDGPESRHGKMPPGWKRISLQIPIPLSRVWVREAENKGVSSIKTMGTAAVAVYLGMPEPVRDEFFQEVQRLTWGGAADISPEAVWTLLRAMLLAHEAGEPLRREWQVTRILDPELTLPPGRKPSDRPQRASKGA